MLVFILAFSLTACNKDTAPETAASPNSSSSNSNNDDSNNQNNDDNSPSTSGAPAEITVAYKWFPNSLDPISEDSAMVMSIVYHICDRLVNFDSDNNMYPGVATSWRQVDSLTWEFDISLDYMFQNGDKLTMDDIVFSIQRLKDIPRSADIGVLIDSIFYEGNKLTIRVVEENNSLLTRILSTAIIVNKNYIEENGEDAVFSKPIGTGPYKIAEFTPGTIAVLEKWEDYPFEKPQIDKITFIVSAEDAARYILIETGQAQYTAWLTPYEMDLAERNDKTSTFYGESRKISSICFNCERPPFDNVNVRRALSYAVDRDAFASLQGGGRPPIRSILFGGYSMYYESPNLPDYNLDKAKELLESEGYNESNPLRFELLTYAPADPGLELYQSALKSIGVEMQINAVEISVMMSMEGSGDFEVEWVNQLNRGNHPLTDLDRFDYVNFFGTRDISRYYNKRVQEIVERMRVSSDQQEMDALTIEINDILADEVPMIGVIIPQNLAAMDSRLSGVVIRPDVVMNFRDAIYSG